MSELARALTGRGHRLSLFYFYAPTDPGSEAIILNLQSLAQTPGSHPRRSTSTKCNAGRPGTGTRRRGRSHRKRLKWASTDSCWRCAIACWAADGSGVTTASSDGQAIFGRYKIARLVDVIRNLPPASAWHGGRSTRGSRSAANGRFDIRILVLFRDPK